MLWCAAWHQKPAASLPNDDRALARLAGYGFDIESWLKVKAGALRCFIECLLHVPYRLETPAVADLIGGKVQVLFGVLPVSIERIKAGEVRPLAVTTATRSEALPNVPTVGEFVFGYEASQWYGIGAPKNTPAEIISKLNNEINAALADPVMKARIVSNGTSGFPISPAEFARLVGAETENGARSSGLPISRRNDVRRRVWVTCRLTRAVD
jgi:tripartite-type tricarboxylate transporter receptor subunit TctC